MVEKILKVVVPILVVGLILCVVLILQQRRQLDAMDAKFAEQSAQFSELHVRLAEQSEQLNRVSRALKFTRASQASNIKMRSLPSGVYTLSTEVIVDPFSVERDEYVIYNFVLDISVGAVRRKLQFGYGRSGYLTHVIYFDHDSDGAIDTKMMNDYVKEIPIPGVESLADMLIDSDHSQAIYDAFRLNVDSAEQLSMDGVTDSTNATIDAMWDWLKEQSEGLSEWVEKSIEFD